MTSVAPTPDLRRRRKDARPAELAAAALRLFVDRGYMATRLDDVAAAAGVSKGTLYLYYPGKEALFRAVIEEGMVAALSLAEHEVAAFRGSAADLLHALLIGWWERIGGTPLAGVTKLIISESRNFPEVAQYYREQVLDRGRALVRATIARGIAEGEFRPLDVDAVVDIVIAPLLLLAVSRFSLPLATGSIAPEDYLDTHFELLVNGLKRS